MILSGGLRDRAATQRAYEHTGAAAVMLARGSLGNPWLFAELLGERDQAPSHEAIVAELRWIMDRAVEHLGEERAGRYLRKFYPWYLERLGASKADQERFQRAASLAQARVLLELLEPFPAAA